MKRLSRFAVTTLFALSVPLFVACEKKSHVQTQSEINTVRYRSILEESISAKDMPEREAVMTIGPLTVSKSEFETWLNTSETRHLRSFLGEQMGIDTMLKQMKEFNLLIYDGIESGVLGESSLGARIENFEIVAFGNYYLKRYLVPKAKGEIEGSEISDKMLYRDRSVRVSMIGLETIEEAQKTHRELKEGKDFAALVRERSILPYANKGGDLGFLNYGNHFLPGQITTLIFSNPRKGYLSEIFKNTLGYCIVKVEDVRYLSSDEISGLARDIISQEANERSADFLDHILDDVDAVVNEDLLGRLPAMKREQVIENYGRWIARLGGRDISVESFIYFLNDHYYKGNFSLARDLNKGLKAYLKYRAAAVKFDALGISIEDGAVEFIKNREKKIVYDYVIGKIKEELVPPEKELRDYFQKNRTSFDEKESLKLRMIMVSTEQKANDIYALLEKNPVSFAHLATRYSEDRSKIRGGEIGFVSRNQVKQSLWDAVISLNDGEFSKVVSDETGYFILKREGYTRAKKVRYEEVKDQVRGKIIDKRYKGEYEKVIGQLETKYDVGVNYELIKKLLN